MTQRTDYNSVAAKINYSALEKKLEQLESKKPPRARKHLEDVLAPVTGLLRKLRAKGWTYEQLSAELSQMGIPVKPSALRDHLASRTRRVTTSADESVHSPETSALRDGNSTKSQRRDGSPSTDATGADLRTGQQR
jgi:hypothetical protein